jgi:Activator of Hsp90 ATPase homolog 1-like protein
MTERSYTTQFHVRATPGAVYAAIVDPRTWWDGEFEGSADAVGDEFTYRFEELHASRQRVTELVPDERVTWLVVEGGPTFVDTGNEWAGTTIVFDLAPAGDGTELRFTHLGLVPQFECYEACSAAWTHYVGESLRRFVTSRRAGSAADRGSRQPASPDSR